MSEQNIDNNVADAADIAAASAATEEFTNTIGDSIAPAETEEVEAAVLGPVLHDEDDVVETVDHVVGQPVQLVGHESLERLGIHVHGDRDHRRFSG